MYDKKMQLLQEKLYPVINLSLCLTKRRCHGVCTALRKYVSALWGRREIRLKALDTPNGDATAFVRCYKNLSARCVVAAKYA